MLPAIAHPNHPPLIIRSLNRFHVLHTINVNEFTNNQLSHWRLVNEITGYFYFRIEIIESSLYNYNCYGKFKLSNLLLTTTFDLYQCYYNLHHFGWIQLTFMRVTRMNWCLSQHIKLCLSSESSFYQKQLDEKWLIRIYSKVTLVSCSIFLIYENASRRYWWSLIVKYLKISVQIFFVFGLRIAQKSHSI